MQIQMWMKEQRRVCRKSSGYSCKALRCSWTDRSEKEEALDSDIEALIQERQDARKARNFARADEIRDQLLEMGIELKDTREGVKWKRI